MATIDPSIALNIRPPQIENPMNALARVMQIKGLQQDAELGRFNMEEKRRSVDENNRLNALFSSAVGPDGRLDRNRLLTGAAKGGLGSRIPGLQKQFLEQDKGQAELDTKKMEVASKRVDMMGQTLGFVRQNPTLENAVAAINHLVQNGAMPPEKGQEALAKFQANPTPEAIASFAELGFRAALSAKDQLANLQTRNLGGTTDTLAIDPVTGQTRTVNTVQNTQSPDNRASTAASMANANARIAAARETASATRDAARMNDRRDTEMKFADDYRAQSKPFKEVADAHATISTSLKHATTSAAATLAGATKFMKLLDPGSVVRESELGMALAATGVFDRATNYINTLKHGKVLSPKQAADFENISNQIFEAAKKQQQTIDSNYKRQAEQNGLRPDMIIQDLGQNKPAKPTRGTGREASGSVEEGPSVFDQADAILRGGS